MKPFSFFIKEFLHKTLYLLLLILLLSLLLLYYAKSITVFLLDPIYQSQMKTLIFYYDNWGKTHIEFQTKKQITSLNIPSIELNIPIFTTSTLVLKYVILLIFYLVIPLLLYFIKISIQPVLKPVELFQFNIYYFYLIILHLVIFLLNHFYLIPSIIEYSYRHYYESTFYELDVEFQIPTYLNIYFQMLYANLIVYWIIQSIQFLKKTSKTKLYLFIYIALFLYIPPDFNIYITFHITYIFYMLLTSFTTTMISRIKKEKYL